MAHRVSTSLLKNLDATSACRILTRVAKCRVGHPSLHRNPGIRIPTSLIHSSSVTSEHGSLPKGVKLSAESGSGSADDAFDVVIVGGGMVGAALACSLASSPLTRSLRMALIDSQPIDRIEELTAPAGSSSSSSPPEVRVSAITPAAANLFKDVGAWNTVMSSRMGRFDRMQVWDAGGQGFVRYDATDLNVPVLGYVVENKVLQGSLISVLKEKQNAVSLICPAQVLSVELPGSKWRAGAAKAGSEKHRNVDTSASTSASASASERGSREKEARTALAVMDDWAEVVLANGRRIRARLVVGADGSRSKVREMVGLRSTRVDYDQRAVIGTVAVESHHTTAWQRFLPRGPLALLPMANRFSNIVWTTSMEHGKELETLSDQQFAAAVNKALNDDYSPPPPSPLRTWLPSIVPSPLSFFVGSAGRGFEPPPRVTEAFGKRLSFPLSLSFTGKYVLPRLALVGDAAHTVHPLAGQGVNLGFMDAASLAKLIAEGVENGADIGDISFLEDYESERKKNNWRMIAGLHALQRLFCTQSWPLPLVRNIGLDAVQLLGPVKNRIMSYAMGVN